MKIKIAQTFTTLFALIALGGITSGCAGIAPVPGGKDTVNTEKYETREDLFENVRSIKTGMPEGQVLNLLNTEADDLYILSRSEILIDLYGTDNIRLDPAQSEKLRKDRLYGYRLIYRNVSREMGLNNPISMRTNKQGYQYTVSFIFKNGILFEDPIIAGGEVNESKSSTVFDMISPSRVVNSAIP